VTERVSMSLVDNFQQCWLVITRLVWSIIEIILSDPAMNCKVNMICYSVREYVAIEESE